MARAYFNKGWPEAVADLQGAVERFVISPYVTEAALRLKLKRGDRLLTQNQLSNFITGSSDLLTLKKLIGQGIDIRSQDRIHAKVYMGVFGQHAVGWLGSANLIRNGRSDGCQVEAMAEPFLLERDFIEGVEESWETAKHLDPDQARREIEVYEATLLQQNMSIEAVQSVVALHVRLKPSGNFALGSVLK